MNQPKVKISWLIRNELRLGWRQQQQLFGKFGALISPLLLLSLYIALNIAFALLYLAIESSHGHTHIAYHMYGWALIGIWFYLVAFTVVPVAEMVSGQSDWDIIVSSPFPLRFIVIIRLLLIVTRALVLPILLLSPIINIRIISGEPELLQFYPAVFSLGLSAVGASTLFAFMLPARASLVRAKAYFALIGLGMIGFFTAASLLRSNILIIARIIASIESNRVFMAIDWLGSGMFAALLPLATLCFVGIGSFIVVLDPIVARILDCPKRYPTVSITKSEVNKYIFPDSLLHATIKKEWRLARRDWHFFLDLLREVIIISTILILVYDDAGSSLVNAAAALSVSMCAVIANDLSWRMAAVEQLPDLIATSPIDASAILHRKLIAASIPSLTGLAIFCLVLSFWTPQTACLTLLFGVCAIGGALLLNGKRNPIDGGSRGSRIQQGAAIVLIQALNAFSWSLGLYFALASSATIAFALVVIGFVTTACVVLSRRFRRTAASLSMSRPKEER